MQRLPFTPKKQKVRKDSERLKINVETVIRKTSSARIVNTTNLQMEEKTILKTAPSKEEIEEQIQRIDSLGLKIEKLKKLCTKAHELKIEALKSFQQRNESIDLLEARQ